MSQTCLTIIPQLNKAIDDANNTLIDNMTDTDMNYEWVCIKPNVTYNFYYMYLKNKWDEIINEFINRPDKCRNRLAELSSLYQIMTPDKIEQVRHFFDEIDADKSGLSKKGLSSVNIDNIVLEATASWLTKPEIDSKFGLSENFSQSISDLSKIMIANCQCQMFDIFKTFIKKYKQKYQKKFQNKSKDEVIEMLRYDYGKFKSSLKKFLKQEFYLTNA